MTASGPREPETAREAKGRVDRPLAETDREALSMGHTFGAALWCMRRGCGATWASHQDDRERCRGGRIVTKQDVNGRTQAKEEGT